MKAEVKAPSPQTTLVLLLGASEWPSAPRFDKSEAFVNSANDLKRYFLDPLKFHLPEENLLDLFDTDKDPDYLDEEIGRFLSNRIAEMENAGCAASDVIVYFVGHGDFTDDFEFYLAIRHTREANPMSSSIQIKPLAHTIKENARYLRRLIILDCCFAASATKMFQGAGSQEQSGLLQTVQAFEESGKVRGFPSKGTSLLCSSRYDATSLTLPGERYTAFTSALLQVLNTGDPGKQELMTLRMIADLSKNYLFELGKKNAVSIPNPEVHSPDQSEGDVAEVPFFPNLARRVGLASQNTFKKFEPLEGVNQCCVIVSETGEKLNELESIVQTVLKKYKKKIERITEQGLHKELYVMKVSDIMFSKENYKNAIIALCRSSIAIFDITNYEPVVMLLLGIRSVVRRGVTILSADGKYAIENPLDAPFNIKEVNIISHSDKNLDRYDPIDSIGLRIVEGFRQFLRLPYYLDLPAFDAIRTLPPDPSSQIPKDYTDQVLVLCSFGEEYRKNNWSRHIRRYLGVFIQEQEELEQEPDIVRTLDLKSPRLVSQVLYETIRLTDMCIVDWTTWRPNVFFEMGVRLAASDISPVCIIEDEHKSLLDALPKAPEELQSMSKPKGVSIEDLYRLNCATSQCARLIALFKPVEYETPAGGNADKDAYIEMVSRYNESIKKVNDEEGDFEGNQQVEQGWGSPSYNYTYKVITDSIDWRVEVAARPVYSELIDSANLLDTSEISSGGRSPVLYPKNKDLDIKAEEGARERRLAAWYYLERKYSQEERLRDTKLAQQYETLGNVLIRSLKRSSKESDKALASTIEADLEKFKELSKEVNAHE